MKSNTYILKSTVLALTTLFFLNACAVSATPKLSQCANNLGSPILNFCEVKPNILWRGAKPDKETAAWLIDKHVKTIVNLELLHDDLNTLPQIKLTHTDTVAMDYFRVQTWEPLYAVAESIADEHVVHFLAIANQAKPPIYVHCRAGENRTGVMIAAYKIILDNQTSPAEISAVLNEMQSYKGVWSDATTKYIKGLSLRRDEILRKVKAFTVEHPTHIICNNGKCTAKTFNHE